MNDIWFNILLRLSYTDIFNICTINKSIYNICNNKYFWFKKFKKDKIPYIINKNCITVNQWIDEYVKIELALNTMRKLTYHIVHNCFYGFTDGMYLDIVDLNLNHIDWVPNGLKNTIINNIHQHHIHIMFKINNKKPVYGIEFSFKEQNTFDTIEIFEPVKRSDFILYLTKFFYYYPTKGIFNRLHLSYEDLIDEIPSPVIYYIFPNW